MPHVTLVHTMSGSVYRITELDDGSFTAGGDNVPSDTSTALGASDWPIVMPYPWPPKVGAPFVITSIFVDQPIGSPHRMPGGGKRTSPVTRVEEPSR